MVDRRDFLTWVAAGSVAVTSMFTLATALKIITPPGRSIDGRTKIGAAVIGRLSELEVGRPRIVEWGDDFVFLVKLDPYKVVGLSAACPHVGCKLRFNERSKQFDCPCHAASFALNGQRLAGPAPRDMISARLLSSNDEITIVGFESTAGS